ncbi:protein VARIATION IN COMPOUND TRIGGERED ROOT growth response-like [Silene latifolia]|uniref:protein VARIATION IN COMPOUND TRIGGERED ROOT growth response-like n=1 Tax=Silene latifolia TaxID=37657 RepID=UPI003D76DC1E
MRKFEIFDCASLKKIPSSLEECTSLETLLIKMIPIIEGPPMHFSRLRRLFSLTVCCYSAEDLRSMLKSVQHLPALEILGIGGYKDEEEMSEYFSDITPYKYLQSLKSLSLFGSPNIKTLPQQPGLLTQIESLYIWDFEDLEEIPDSICNISSLEYLSFGGCKNLKCIPSRQILQRLPKLSVLQIINCPLLAERYDKHKGPGWHNISHIKFIFIDGEEIH